MKKLAVGGLWLEGCIGCVMMALTPAQAAPPLDTLIVSAEDAAAFAVPDPYVFEGQTLQVEYSFSSQRDIRLERLAPVVVGAGVQFELKGAVSSEGLPLGTPLEKRGLGTLTLSGQNRYTSNTVLREGVLRLSGNSALGSKHYSLQQAGGTVLKLDPGARLENFVQLAAARPGDVPLPGLQGVAQWQVDSGTAVLANSVNAALPVRKTGAGTLRLKGIVQGHNNLHVEAGALAVDAVAAARLSVGRGARLEGAGELAHLHVQAGGMVAPAGREEAGTLSVWGNATFDADSQYHVNADADGRADRLHVGGQAELDGHVLVQAGAGDWADENRYLILRADAGLNGTRFASVKSDLAFLDPSLDYDPHHVYLTLQRNDLNPGDIGETDEEQEVGDAITPSKPKRPKRPRPSKSEEAAPEPEVADTGPDVPEAKPEVPETGPDTTDLPAVVPAPQPGTALEDGLQGMSVSQVRSLLQQASGRWHASVRSFLLEDSRHVRQAVLAGGRRGVHAPTAWRSWAQAYSSRGRRNDWRHNAYQRHHSHGLVLGLDAPASDRWRLGLGLAAQRAQLKQGDGLARANVDSFHTGVLAYGDWSGMQVTAALLRTWHRIDSRRRVAAGPLIDLHHSRYLGHSWQAVLELAPHLRSLSDWGVRLRHGLKMAPYLRYEWARLSLPGHHESGGPTAHEVNASHTSTLAGTLGIRAHYTWPQDASRPWVEADFGWHHAWGNTRVVSRQRMRAGEGGATSAFFQSQGQSLLRDALAIDLEAGLSPRRNAQFRLRYSGLLGSGYRDHAAWADLRWVF